MVKAFSLKLRARAAPHRNGRHELAWMHGRVSILLLEDFVGAAFGAVFFAVTSEIWEIAKHLHAVNILAIFTISMIMGFSLVYLSRRRKAVSIQLEHAASLRAVEIYAISFLTSLLFVFVFNTAATMDLMLKQTVVIALPAVVSAATADLLFF
ncbi:MAG: DUF2391 family protein [DPANN group archaeon]|nr:DUF2391 family protein [DPANN group archaeon]